MRMIDSRVVSVLVPAKHADAPIELMVFYFLPPFHHLFIIHCADTSVFVIRVNFIAVDECLSRTVLYVEFLIETQVMCNKFRKSL